MKTKEQAPKIYDKKPEPVVAVSHIPDQADVETLANKIQARIEKEDTDKIELVGEITADFVVEMVKSAEDGVKFWEGVRLFQSASNKAKVVHDNFEELIAEIKDLSAPETEELYTKFGKLFFDSLQKIKAEQAEKGAKA